MDFNSIPVLINVGFFVLAAAGVWFAGARLSVYADIISDRLEIDKALMGFVFLAFATELPEIVTNLTAAIRGNGVLVVNGMFGGIVMQTAVLAIADMAVYNRILTLTYLAYRSINQLQGTFLVLSLALLLVSALIGDIALVGHIGLTPVLLAGLYMFAVYIFMRYQKNTQWQALDTPDAQQNIAPKGIKSRFEGANTQKLVYHAVASGIVILVAGILLVQTVEAIAYQTGLGSSLIGVTLLAASTSLPELSTTITAVRLGAHSMAISNIFGSNLLMVFLLLPSDMFYREGLLLESVDKSARFALIAGIVVTAAYLIGLILRRPKRVLGMGIDSWFVMLFYVASLFVFYQLR